MDFFLGRTGQRAGRATGNCYRRTSIGNWRLMVFFWVRTKIVPGHEKSLRYRGIVASLEEVWIYSAGELIELASTARPPQSKDGGMKGREEEVKECIYRRIWVTYLLSQTTLMRNTKGLREVFAPFLSSLFFLARGEGGRRGGGRRRGWGGEKVVSGGLLGDCDRFLRWMAV